MPPTVPSLTGAGQSRDIVLRWRVHLARRSPARAAAAMMIVLAVAACAYAIWARPVAAAVAGLLVFAAVAEFLLPLHYRITRQGISCRNLLSARYLKWAEVKRCYHDAHGIKLSPLPRPSRLEAYRGVYLWLGDDADAVIAAVRRYLREARS
jgi:hypothetical protein